MLVMGLVPEPSLMVMSILLYAKVYSHYNVIWE